MKKYKNYTEESMCLITDAGLVPATVYSYVKPTDEGWKFEAVVHVPSGNGLFNGKNHATVIEMTCKNENHAKNEEKSFFKLLNQFLAFEVETKKLM